MEEKNIPLGETPDNNPNTEVSATTEDDVKTPSTEQAADAITPTADESPKPEESAEDDRSEPAPSEKPLEIIPEVPSPAPKKAPVATYAYRWDYESQASADRKSKKRGDHGVRNFAIIMSIAFLLSLATLIGVLFIGEFSPSTQSAEGVSLNELYNKCYPSYVAISVVSEWGATSCGSGIIMTEDGYITTNYHVVEDGKDINVILHDGTTVPATYIDGDELNDIAIIKIDKKGLEPAVIGKSANAKVGDQVMAIGTPYSTQYRGTMTSGYVSALNRKYAAKNDNGTVNKVITLLQTDTSVNPGNSGGPLFNMKGEVIGIVSMKISGSQYEGMGFAIPIDGVLDMINDIIENGKLTIPNGGSAVEGAALGISGFAVEANTKYLLTGDYHYTVTVNDDGTELVNYITSLGTVLPIPLNDEELLENYDIKDYTFYTADATGVVVMSMSAGFDSAKKLQEKDIIVSANGRSCEYMETLQELIANSRVGDTVEFEIFRNGTTLTVTVELGRSAAMD